MTNVHSMRGLDRIQLGGRAFPVCGAYPKKAFTAADSATEMASAWRIESLSPREIIHTFMDILPQNESWVTMFPATSYRDGRWR